MSTRFFSDAEIRRLRSWPEELGRDELIRFTLHRLGSRKDLTSVFPNAGKLLTGTVDVGLIRSQWDEMLRLAASLKYGHATASLVVGKLHASSRRSAIAQALVEFGGLQRTIYALRYLADEAYRRRITRQLNKGESLHSLRRDLFFAHEGSVRRRHHEQQTEQALCLSLVVNAIITWNTAYRRATAATPWVTAARTWPLPTAAVLRSPTPLPSPPTPPRTPVSKATSQWSSPRTRRSSARCSASPPRPG
jgi:Tn3 transposase DDE domain